MTKVIIIDRSGEIKTVNVKDISAESLYKKAGLKSAEGFALQHTWGQEDGLDQSIELYAKKTGKAGQENKYDFPPPVDQTLFFGPCLLLGKDPSTGKIVDLDESEWEEIYEFLFGGFEDIGSEDSESEVDTDEESAAIQGKLTRDGYVKDGFIVEDDDEDDEDYDESEDDSEPTPPPPPKKAKGRPPAATSSNLSTKKPKSATNATATATLQKTLQTDPVVEKDILLEECESELSEEEYL